MSALRRRRALFVLVVTAIAGTAAAVIAGVSDAGTKVVRPAVPELGVFSEPADTAVDPRLAGLADSPRFVSGGKSGAADLFRLHVLGRDLGAFSSTLVVLPYHEDRGVCYALLGRTETDPGMSYCYLPLDPQLPDELKDQHFSGSWFYTNVDGVPRVQLFGVAFDDVNRLRLSVNGSWREVPVSRNGFYLDLPGASYKDSARIEATLADGSKRVYDFPNTDD